MRIGILTFHKADNCGAVLQAYALTETIKTHFNDIEVEIINYYMPNITHQYKYISLNTTSFKSFLKSVISTTVHLKRKLSSRPKYKNFREKYMNISEKQFKISKNISGYDIYIVGSDQVWNYDITGGDTVFLLDFVDKNIKNKKIAYAASIAKDNIDDNEIKHIVKYINDFDYISVRESSAYRTLNKFITKTIEQVLDPTLIAEKSLWYNLIKKNSFNNSYILVYMVTLNHEVLKAAEDLSKRLDLPVWCITTSFKTYHYNFKFIKDVGPIEFLNLFANAEFILTSSFHGTAFSIIFNKNFVTIPYKKTSSRMVDLLQLLKLDDRLIKNSEELNNEYCLEIDYAIPNKILEYEKQRSLDFLRRALKN